MEQEKQNPELNATINGRSNNSFNPTANSAAFIRQIEGLMRCVRGGLIRALGASHKLKRRYMLMQPLIDVLAQMTDPEKQDFTSWLSKLDDKDKQVVMSALAKTTPDRLRTILSIPEDQRVTILKGPKGFFEKMLQPLDDLDKWAAGPGGQRISDRKDKALLELKRTKAGECLNCGTPLSGWDKFNGHRRCKKCR